MGCNKRSEENRIVASGALKQSTRNSPSVEQKYTVYDLLLIRHSLICIFHYPITFIWPMWDNYCWRPIKRFWTFMTPIRKVDKEDTYSKLFQVIHYIHFSTNSRNPFSCNTHLSCQHSVVIHNVLCTCYCSSEQNMGCKKNLRIK